MHYRCTMHTRVSCHSTNEWTLMGKRNTLSCPSLPGLTQNVCSRTGCCVALRIYYRALLRGDLGVHVCAQALS